MSTEEKKKEVLVLEKKVGAGKMTDHLATSPPAVPPQNEPQLITVGNRCITITAVIIRSKNLYNIFDFFLNDATRKEEGTKLCTITSASERARWLI